MRAEALVKPSPKDTEIEDFKRQLRLKIADAESQLSTWKEALAKLDGEVFKRAPERGILSHLSAIEAVESYIRDRGKPQPRKQMVSDLVMLGVCFDSKSKGGPKADINRSISRFLKYGRAAGQRSVLVKVGDLIGLRAS